MIKLFKNKEDNKGSVLLIAILMSTVVFVVGVGVYQRTYKELLFSSMWRQTQVAFSAADSGLECAIYRDLHPASTSCFGTAFAWTPVNPGTWYSLDHAVGSGCVGITVTKTFNATLGRTITTVDARGYNDACNSTNPRRVERGLRITY